VQHNRPPKKDKNDNDKNKTQHNNASINVTRAMRAETKSPKRVGAVLA